MRTAKNGHIVYFFVSLFLTCITFSAKAQNSVMDLNAVPQYSYFGQDDLRRRAACHLEIDAPQRDFAGRPVQNFRIWVDPSQYSTTLRYKGSARQLNPEAQSGPNQLRFKIQADGYELIMITERSNTSSIVEYRLNDVSGVSGHPGAVVNCLAVRNTRR